MACMHVHSITYVYTSTCACINDFSEPAIMTSNAVHAIASQLGLQKIAMTIN